MTCPRCGSDDVTLDGTLHKRVYWCRACQHYFTRMVPLCA